MITSSSTSSSRGGGFSEDGSTPTCSLVLEVVKGQRGSFLTCVLESAGVDMACHMFNDLDYSLELSCGVCGVIVNRQSSNYDYISLPSINAPLLVLFKAAP